MLNLTGQIVFDECNYIISTLLMSDNQENPPRKRVTKEFKDTIKLNSRSDWKRWNLDVLGFEFYPMRRYDLQAFIHGTYQPAPNKEFNERNSIDLRY